MKKISVVIPCYRSEHTIQPVVSNLCRILEQRSGAYDYEIILVSDHSPDNVYAVIAELARQNPKIHGMEFSRNFGQHAALMAGYRKCTGDIVVSMDDDGETPAGEMFKLIDKLEEGYDAVYAAYPDVKHNWFRNVTSKMTRRIMGNMIGIPNGLYTSSYYAAKKFVIDEMVKYENPYPFTTGLLFRTTHNAANVTVEHCKRLHGSSGYSLRKLISLFMNGFTAFSVKPLRLATILGFLFATIGLLYGIFIVIRKLILPNIATGYSSMMAAILFMGGMIMLMCGMIGEYIGRIYISMNKAPQYVVKQTTEEMKKAD